jgi:hypothetical protein
VRDWNVLVREKFSGRDLTDLQRTEVVSELAAHLEDLYEHERSVGITEAEAISRALSEVDNWHQLSRNINRARKVERQMNSRTKSLWLPGFTTLIAAACALAIVNRFNLEPRIYWYGSTAVLHWYAYVPAVAGNPSDHRRNRGVPFEFGKRKFEDAIDGRLVSGARSVRAFLSRHRTRGSCSASPELAALTSCVFGDGFRLGFTSRRGIGPWRVAVPAQCSEP